MRLFLVLASLTLWPASLLVVQTPQRPNILFIFSDDHAYQAISAYGSRINQTPNIDRIAREGMRFDTALVTNSIWRAQPSRGPDRQVWTSERCEGHRATFDGSQQTLPKLLQRAGYETALIGKWHLKSDPVDSTTGKCCWGKAPSTTRTRAWPAASVITRATSPTSRQT